MKLVKLFDTWMNLERISGISFLDMRHPTDKHNEPKPGDSNISTQIWFGAGGCVSIQGKSEDEVAETINKAAQQLEEMETKR